MNKSKPTEKEGLEIRVRKEKNENKIIVDLLPMEKEGVDEHGNIRYHTVQLGDFPYIFENIRNELSKFIGTTSGMSKASHLDSGFQFKFELALNKHNNFHRDNVGAKRY